MAGEGKSVIPAKNCDAAHTIDVNLADGTSFGNVNSLGEEQAITLLRHMPEGGAL